MKPTTIENQVVILSFGSSQFVSFVDSRNRTHDENLTPNGLQNNLAKIQIKIFLTDSKSPIEKNFNGKDTEKMWKKLKEGSKGSTIVKKIENHAISWNIFRIQTNMAVCDKRHMSISVLGTVLICKPPNISIWRQKRFYRLKRSGFFFIVESGQPYYGPFMDSD